MEMVRNPLSMQFHMKLLDGSEIIHSLDNEINALNMNTLTDIHDHLTLNNR